MTNRERLRAVPRSAVAALGVLVLGALPLWFSAEALDEWSTKLEQARIERGLAAALLEEARRENTRIAALRTRLQALMQHSGDAENGDLSALTLLGAGPGVFTFDHRIHSASSPSPDVPGLPGLRLRRLAIEATVLHEQGLVDSLAAFLGRVPGFAIPLACSVARLPQSTAAQAQLAATCELDWLALQPPAGDSPQ